MTQTILIVDGAPFDEKLATAIEEYGYVPLCAEGVEEAILLLKQRHASIDLMVLDTSMPFIEGISVLGHCRSHYPYIPVIALCEDGHENAAEAQRWRIEQFISKSAWRDELENAVSDVLLTARTAAAQ